MKQPVFVVGCPRSGTTLLYSMLVAAGGFAFYRKETYFFDLLPRFPDLSDPRCHGEFTTRFLAGYLGKVPGLDVAPLVHHALATCRTSAEFLPLLMEGIARAQEMERWIEATPVHVLYMETIARTVPDALFVHVIRDGRDCALSNVAQGWSPVLPGDGGSRLGVAALQWEWMVREGRAFARTNPGRCLELRFEDLIADPSGTLRLLGRFIDHDLEYERIRGNPVHALQRPNTSFREERERADFNPTGRWRTKCSSENLAACEALIGEALEELGYERAHAAGRSAARLQRSLRRGVYLRYFAGRRYLKTKTPLGRWLTSTRVWAEQPRANEEPVAPIPGPSSAATCQMVLP